MERRVVRERPQRRRHPQRMGDEIEWLAVESVYLLYSERMEERMEDKS